MDTPTPEKIEMFMSITGASELVAVQKLQQNRCDLNEAVNAYFNEGDHSSALNTGTGADTYRSYIPPRDDDEMDIDNPGFQIPTSQNPGFQIPTPPFTNPFSLLSFPGDFLNNPRVSQPRVSREIPIEVKDENAPASSGPSGPKIEEVTDLDAGPEAVNPTVIIDEADDDDFNGNSNINNINNTVNVIDEDGNINDVGPTPSAPLMVENSNDIEEQMILAAIEASKRDAEGAFNLAEQERASRIQPGNAVSDFPLADLPTNNIRAGTSNTINESDEEEETDEIEEVPLVRHRYPTRRPASRSQPVNYQEEDDPEEDEIDTIPHGPRNAPSDEWGGLSNMEHDEAVMLEAAMFGGIPDGAAYRFNYPLIGSGSNNNNNIPGYPRMPVRAPSPGLTEQRLLREQQDDEYLAALQADQEKELKAVQEREAEMEREKLEEQENKRKLEEQEEMERKLLEKEARLPEEPAQEDENSVTLLVRLPDGTRRGRRFLKSHKLQSLFDFIDVARIVKPDSYRLVRPYPRLAFTNEESDVSLNELGLNSKQEALFLETI